MTDGFVDNTVTIMTRALIPNPDLRAALEVLDDKYAFTGPLCHISKMLVCVQKSSTPELVRWTLFMAIDLFESGEMPAEGISERALRGAKGVVGHVEVWCFKHACKVFLLGTWLDSMLTDTLVKDTLRAKLNTFADYRAHVNPICISGATADLSWQRGWPHSTTLLLQFIEAVVYGRLYDPSLRAAVKGQKTVSELLETAMPLKEAMEEIRKAKVKEQTEKKDQATGSTEGNTTKAPLPPPDDGANNHDAQIKAALASGSISMTPNADNATAQFVAIARRKIAANVVLCSAGVWN